jgi:ribosome-binding factor A
MMAKEFDRRDRVSRELKKNLAMILQKNIRDPRLNSIILTISEVILSRDLKHAKVFITFLDGQDSSTMESKIGILTSCSNYIRFLLSKSMKLRQIPSLKFFQDDTLASGSKISQILATVLNENKETPLSRNQEKSLL